MQATKNKNEENNKPAVHGIQMPHDWFLALYLPEEMKKCNIS